MGYLLCKVLKAGWTPFLSKFWKPSLFKPRPRRCFHVRNLYFSGYSPNCLSIPLTFCMLNSALMVDYPLNLYSA